MGPRTPMDIGVGGGSCCGSGGLTSSEFSAIAAKVANEGM
jgi:hypothetical protein